MYPAPAAFVVLANLPSTVRFGLSCPRSLRRRPRRTVRAPSPQRRAFRLPALSHAGNGVSSQPSLPDGDRDGDGDRDASKSQDVQLPSDSALAKEQLLRIIAELINDDKQIRRAELLIRQLESAAKPPLTQPFTDLAISGSWKLAFSSTRTRAKGNIRIRQIGQLIQPEHKLLVNHALWTFPDKFGVGQIHATLRVECSYQYVTPGRLKVQVHKHIVKIQPPEQGKTNHMPADMKPVITELQLSLPVEFFDPSGLLDITYVDPNFRLTRFMGKKLAGARNVFTRAT